MVGPSPERERRQRDVETEGTELAREVVASGAVSLGRGARVTDAFERDDMTPQPLREVRALTGR
ncbi:MAG: hypothetical protein DMD60_10540 [Gemmatimonadetes bacterium]|nr:MAG: hypothetical protein DMD60_10540 [Gemmatimonadota bacterium]